MSGALIVTAELGGEDFAWLDGLRRRNFPLDRNQVPRLFDYAKLHLVASRIETDRALFSFRQMKARFAVMDVFPHAPNGVRQGERFGLMNPQNVISQPFRALAANSR